MGATEEPVSKLPKLTAQNDSNIAAAITTHTKCQHFLQRKKRLCRIMVAKGALYCGEHTPLIDPVASVSNDELADEKTKRVVCPLDSRHTVYERRLAKHLQICNAKPTARPAYFVPGMNAGAADCDPENRDFKLVDLDEDEMNGVIEKVKRIFDEYQIDNIIEEQHMEHPLLATELNNEIRSHETLKHLKQTASILGHLDSLKLLQDNTAFVEFGAGKGDVACWLARAVEHLTNTRVLLIDRASLRHKRDVRLRETHEIHRIKADINDLDIRHVDHLQTAQRIVATGKHLCGGATDLAMRCVLTGNDNNRSDGKTEAFIIALCCYHRCTWRSFVGKQFLLEQGLTVRDFSIMTKMVGWAVCGTGLSRERRLEMQKEHGDGEFQL